MKRNTSTVNYDQFHQHTSVQKKVISANNFTYKLIIQTINKYLLSPKEVLDIGCGAGTLALYMASKGHTVTGIDISKDAVNAAKASAKYLKLKKVTFAQMDFPSKIPDKKYDFILCSEVIEHLQNDELALKKMYNLLKKNGVLFITTPSQNAPLHKLGMAREFDKQVGHLRRYTTRELTAKLRKIGFTVVETKETEGIVRNFLYLNPVAGKSVRFIKYFVTHIVFFIDNISLKLFGESNIFIVVEKK